MATTRFARAWADEEEEEEDEFAGSKPGAGRHRFETQADSQGMKTVIEYIERDGKTYKISKKVKEITTKTWTTAAMEERKSMPKFGKAATNSPEKEAMMIKKSDEEIPLEVAKKPVTLATKDDAEDKFYEESIEACNSFMKEKKAWSSANREVQIAREEGSPEEKKPDAPVADAPASGGPAKYVPPSVRAAQGQTVGGKGGGKDASQQQDASLRITNLSEDVKEGDLQELFGPCGRLQRVYLAKHPDTGASKGFAFVTYFSREDAQRAINKLNGHGYDNLILQVMWAKPRA
uniref:Eukaryotic translation initiation factor 3 subunit G n=1 Tax=Noctiluca scintillans TaxID=2966 RepID=A0A7S1FAQ1_NOCSC